MERRGYFEGKEGEERSYILKTKNKQGKYKRQDAQGSISLIRGKYKSRQSKANTKEQE